MKGSKIVSRGVALAVALVGLVLTARAVPAAPPSPLVVVTVNVKIIGGVHGSASRAAKGVTVKAVYGPIVKLIASSPVTDGSGNATFSFRYGESFKPTIENATFSLKSYPASATTAQTIVVPHTGTTPVVNLKILAP